MTYQARKALSEVDLLADLPAQTLDELIQRGTTFTTNPGRRVVIEGDKDAGLHVVLEGSAEITVHGESRAPLGPGDYFGEISMIDGKPRSATIRPEGHVRTLSLAAWNFEPLLEQHPKLAHELLLGLCAHVREAEARSAD